MRHIIFWAFLGFLLAVGILEGLDAEAAHIMRGHVERVALMQAAGKIK